MDDYVAWTAWMWLMQPMLGRGRHVSVSARATSLSPLALSTSCYNAANTVGRGHIGESWETPCLPQIQSQCPAPT
eukprot:1002104-Pelagomonas_calceolata.AAC.1